MAVWIFGQKVYLAGSRSEREELMIVTTKQPPRNVIHLIAIAKAEGLNILIFVTGSIVFEKH